MQKISSITSAAHQAFSVPLSDGTIVDVQLDYRPRIQQWSMSVTYDAFIAENLIVAVHPNLLRQFRHIVPFGIAITTTDGAEPIFIGDFENGRATFYVLESTEVARIETSIFGVSE